MQAYNISFLQVKIGLPYKFLGNIRQGLVSIISIRHVQVID